MAGTYKQRDFRAGIEDQSLINELAARKIVVREPVRLSPGWEGTDKPDDELNFRSLTMDQVDLELNPPKDRLNIVFIIMVLHGIGTLMPWNMFITAKDYFENYKFSINYTGVNTTYGGNYVSSVSFAAQVPNVIFNWINIFMPLGGDLTTRIVWGIFMQVLIFVETIVMAMIDTSGWPGVFFWITMFSVVVLNTFNGIYQNSVYGMAAKLPGKYTGAVVLGSNISGTFTAVINLVSILSTPSLRTAAIYYFLTALFVLLACFDTYFALPINRFYRYHEMLFQKEKQKRELETKSKIHGKTPYWTIFKQCFPQLFNIFFIFFVTLSLFPAVHSNIQKSDPQFLVEDKIYVSVMCFMTFNITAMIGSSIASYVQWPKKEWLVIPVVMRALFIPLFLFCNYQPPNEFVRTLPVYINNDWVYFVIAVIMGLSSGYLSSLGMMYCPSMVDSRYASTAGMFAAAFLITGIFTGVLFAMAMPSVVSLSLWG
ncbi:equilibrative nucleoside transporter 1 isoform X1 [Microplitis mediator]|uniref:equilibrative nucleoside transporter 1 isoform X1 n=2 Tax=Microplitis mediator TaxID=375433 RepID=UPI0025538424|nr:equilibrative nucleoside transporter 1 isoform X1 [Microplitis mediator]XP_057340933.1 equilibrative nucleoside transporter 1 isoform X1 [Microplitis mediator]